MSESILEANRKEPFIKDLPERFKVVDDLIIGGCPYCKGEMFGRCLCCLQYFCHNCEDGEIMSMEDIIECIENRT